MARISFFQEANTPIWGCFFCPHLSYRHSRVGGNPMRRRQLFICPCGAMDTHLRGYDDVFLFFVILGLDPRTQVNISRMTWFPRSSRGMTSFLFPGPMCLHCEVLTKQCHPVFFLCHSCLLSLSSLRRHFLSFLRRQE